MTEKDILWPVKTFEVQYVWSDSTIWNEFEFHQDDIIINAYPKSVSPWLEGRSCAARFGSKQQLLRALEEQTHRRFIKSHLPLDAQVFSPKAKYIVVIRDGRDVACSLYNHLVNFTVEGNVCPQSIQEIFQTRILAKSKTSFFEYTRSWWNIRHLPNVLLVHFGQLKKDLPSEIRRIAKFLEIEIEPLHWDAILEHCSFDYMKKNAVNFMENERFAGDSKKFFCQGTTDRWKNILTQEESQSYEKQAIETLGNKGALWLISGQVTDEKQADD